MGMTREQWLEARRQSIGASDVAAILGRDPRRGPLAVWESKVKGHAGADNDWLAFGRDVEGAIANLYSHRTGRIVGDLGATEIQYHPDAPWLGATLDRITEIDGEDCPLELKHVANFSSPHSWVEEPPVHYILQLQTQIACTGAKQGVLAGMFPGYQLAHRDFNLDSELIDNIMPILEEFWFHNVLKQIPPDPTGLPGDGQAIKRLWPDDNGDTVLLDGVDWVVLANERDGLKASIKAAENRVKEIDTLFKGVIQDNSKIILMDGSSFSLKKVEVKGYVKEVKSYNYRVLRRGKK